MDVNSLKSYEEILTPERLENKIEKINKILKKYGYSSLSLSYDNIVELLGGKIGQKNNDIQEDIIIEPQEEVMDNPTEFQSNPFSLNDDDFIVEDELENLEDGRKLVA